MATSISIFQVIYLFTVHVAGLEDIVFDKITCTDDDCGKTFRANMDELLIVKRGETAAVVLDPECTVDTNDLRLNKCVHTYAPLLDNLRDFVEEVSI